MAGMLLTGWGTRGDCQAVATVAAALAARGHDVILAAPAFMASEAARLGVEFHPVGEDPLAWFDQKTWRRNADPNRVMPALMRLFARQVDLQFERLAPYAASADVIVGQGLSYAAPSLAEAHRVPYIYLSPNVFFFESAHHPSLGINRRGMPDWVNRLTWKQFSITYDLMFRRKINRHRGRYALSPITDARTHIFDPRTTVAILDPELYPVPVDVPLPRPPVGSIAVPPARTTLDEATITFVEAGAPVVLADFGSMPDRKPAATSRLIVEAARAVGARTLLARGWAGLGRGIEPSTDVHVVERLPHSLLFPRADAVIHHGGVGTAAAAARAGVVQVIVPHAYDQHASARCVQAAGVAHEALPRRRLEASSLAQRLNVALTDSALRNRAAELAHVISSRDAIATTVHAIEQQIA